uniref:DUF1778 domain-containing protein n=1 Tax=Gongylonema pulchrum TaxID=637853 RepID=A0A183D4Z6_9BILA
LTRPPSKSSKMMLICRKLSDLICPWATSAVLKTMSMTTDDILQKRRNLLSLAESNCLKMAQKFPAEFNQTAKDYLVRVTPNAAR